MLRDEPGGDDPAPTRPGSGAADAGDVELHGAARRSPEAGTPRTSAALPPPPTATPPRRRQPSTLATTIPEVPSERGPLTGTVRDADGRPVAGARVQVFRKPTAEEQLPKGDARVYVFWVQLPGDVTTDAAGRFTFADVPQGIGLFVQILPPDGPAWSAALDRLGDALEVALERAFTIRGRVLDAATGAPLEGALVRVEGTARGSGAPTGRTTADGTFAFRALPAGRYAVQASAVLRRSDSLGLDRELAPEGLDVRAETEVDAGAEDVELRVWRGYAIAGRVEAQDGRTAVDDVRIEVYARTAAGTPDQRRRAYAGALADGSFVIDALPRGAYDLLFVPRPPEGDGEAPAATWLRAVEAPAADLRVVLESGAPIHGRLLDAAEQPIRGKGGSVYVRESGTTHGAPGGFYAALDDQGGFRTPPVPVGRTYVLFVSGVPGFARLEVPDVRPGADEVRLHLVRGGRIRGMVRTPDGVVAGAKVRVVAWVEGADGLKPGTSGSTYTDVHGQFVIDGLTEAAYSVTAGGAEGPHAPAEPQRGVKPEGEPLDLKMTPGASVSGRLVDPRGKPVQTQTLQAMRLGGHVGDLAWTRVDHAEGRFLLVGLRSGRARLLLFRDGVSVELGEVEVPATGLTIVVPDP